MSKSPEAELGGDRMGMQNGFELRSLKLVNTSHASPGAPPELVFLAGYMLS